MNYSTFRMQQLLYTDFIKSFCEQHPQANWAEIQRKLDVATRQVFEAAVAKKEGGPISFFIPFSRIVVFI